jgi:hypothetical protein
MVTSYLCFPISSLLPMSASPQYDHQPRSLRPSGMMFEALMVMGAGPVDSEKGGYHENCLDCTLGYRYR